MKGTTYTLYEREKTKENKEDQKQTKKIKREKIEEKTVMPLHRGCGRHLEKNELSIHKKHHYSYTE